MLYKIIIFIIFITKALSYNLNYNTRFDITFNKNYVDCICNLMDLRMDKSSILLKNKYEYIIDSYDYNNKNNYLFTPTEKKNETRLFIFIYLKTMF